MIFVADAADIVRGANIFIWTNFAPHEYFCMLCGGKLLHIKINFAPYAFLATLVALHFTPVSE